MAKKERRDPAALVMESENPLARRLGLSGRSHTPLTNREVGGEEGRGASPTAEEVKPPTQPRKPQAEKSKASRKAPAATKGTGKAKRCIVSQDEEDLIGAVEKTIGRKLDTTLQYSPITRALWSLLVDAVEHIDELPAPDIRRPANAAPDIDHGEFEEDLAAYLLQLIRRVKPGNR